MRWPGPVMAAFDAAAASARAGRPAVLGIEGRSGFGKSTLLRSTSARLDGFHLLRAYGEQSAQDNRFQLVDEWQSTHPSHVMQATGLLTEVVDRLQVTGPVALLVDDLQWIDPESVEVLATLAERAEGDRLLVVAAYRPLGRRHAAWRRLPIPTVRLEGLDAEAADALVDSLDPDAPAGLADALREHTGGSPLHMRALLQEHSSPELAQLAARGELPAPADVAAAVDARIAELAPEAAQLLHALAVVGDTWTDVPTAAAVSGVIDPESAIRVLADEELVRLDRSSEVPRIRIAHAVLRAAAYETIPIGTRRVLHRAAAARLTSTGERLRHRLAAAVGPDEGLAVDLDRYADERHDRRLYREAARFRRLAATTSGSAASRERRQLDADVDAMLAMDLDAVSVTDLSEDASAQRRLVYAIRLSARKRWVQAADVLDHVDVQALDGRNAYRALVLHAWTTLASGRRAADALPMLQAAAATPAKDTSYLGLFLTTNGQVQHATIDRSRPLWGFDDMQDADRVTLASSLEGLHRLSWRGSVYAVTGSTSRAIGDLTVVTDRMDDGMLELSDGILHAFLGFAQWARGEWRRASITLGLAQTFVRGVAHPTVLATAPLAAIVVGDDPRPSLARSRRARLAGPVPAAMYTGDVAEVAALAFAGTPRERREWRAQRIADFGAPDPQTESRPSSLWLLAWGIGAAWAGDADATDAWAEALSVQAGGEWRPNAVAWLRALAGRLRGRRDISLGSIAAAGLPGLDSFAALLWVDAARDRPDAHLLQQAQSALTRVGAGRYAPTLLPQTSAPDDPLAALSDRERDVTALMLEGLSYAQIAKELHVSRGTVAFHLSNVYAKTNTASRHELIELNRRVHA